MQLLRDSPSRLQETALILGILYCITDCINEPTANRIVNPKHCSKGNIVLSYKRHRLVYFIKWIIRRISWKNYLHRPRRRHRFRLALRHHSTDHSLRRCQSPLRNDSGQYYRVFLHRPPLRTLHTDVKPSADGQALFRNRHPRWFYDLFDVQHGTIDPRPHRRPNVGSGLFFTQRHRRLLLLLARICRRQRLLAVAL